MYCQQKKPVSERIKDNFQITWLIFCWSIRLKQLVQVEEFVSKFSLSTLQMEMM